MGQAQKISYYTLDEYLAFERETDIRHEYLDGEIVAMGGASRTHNMLVFNLGSAIRPHLRGTSCRIGGSDMKVLIKAVNRSYYPDLVVSCSSPHDEIDDYTETQPRLVVEILSPSTAVVDRTEKRLNYQRLDSLQEYVLVAQNERLVEVYRRQRNGWVHITYGAAEVIELSSLDLHLAMDVIYEDVLSASDER